METKRCWACEKQLPLEEFHRDSRKPDGKQSKCRGCQYARYKERLAADPEGVRGRAAASQRKHRVRRQYGLTREDIAQMADEQGGRCAICQRVPEPLKGSYGGLVVDHCHAGGQVRGLLCHSCNRGLGFLGDDLAALERAVEYLRAHEQRAAAA